MSTFSVFHYFPFECERSRPIVSLSGVMGSRPINCFPFGCEGSRPIVSLSGVRGSRPINCFPFECEGSRLLIVFLSGVRGVGMHCLSIH